MPFLNLKVSAVPSEALSEALVAGLIELTARILHKRPDVTAVTIDYTPPEQWFVGGRSLARTDEASFWLAVTITEGTNTKDEKAAYLAEIFALMRRLLGRDLHEVSYVLVHEVPADAYGYGGLTQEYRFVERRIRSQPAAS